MIYGKISGTGTKNHTRLVNRDQEDQHPIEAISGLSDKLTELETSISKKGNASLKPTKTTVVNELAGTNTFVTGFDKPLYDVSYSNNSLRFSQVSINTNSVSANTIQIQEAAPTE